MTFIISFVGLYSDSEEIDSITSDIKKQIIIGICGSFTELNKPILNGLKEYLRRNKYRNVYSTEDFPYEKPPIADGEAKYGYSYEKSMELVNKSDIVVLFFFNPNGDHGVNESAITEVQELSSKGNRNVIVLIEEGYKFRSNVKGIKYLKKLWKWEDFSKEKMPDCYEFVKQACHDIILERFVNKKVPPFINPF